jgi:hypothetical protein
MNLFYFTAFDLVVKKKRQKWRQPKNKEKKRQNWPIPEKTLQSILNPR